MFRLISFMKLVCFLLFLIAKGNNTACFLLNRFPSIVPFFIIINQNKYYNSSKKSAMKLGNILVQELLSGRRNLTLTNKSGISPSKNYFFIRRETLIDLQFQIYFSPYYLCSFSFMKLLPFLTAYNRKKIYTI